MSRIPQNFIDELVARADIVEIVGTRLQLKKSGREYKACCPFHSEKTPSFWVSPEKQFYHCFGCGAHGTVLRFLMEHDRLPFPEAVEELASRVGLEVPHDEEPSPARRASDGLHELMSRVARFYAEALARDERARHYATARGLDPAIIERFGIGYAPNSWNDVLRRFGGTDDARRQLTEVGLIIERDRGQIRDGERHYDRFRDRLMFPIRDARGRVLAFGGRVIEQGEPKYLNSPETPLFHKGRELYGLYEVRQSRAKLRRLLVVEGYMDAVRLHQFGLTYCVATLGTATTPEHLRRLFQLVNEVVFAFDGDRAGRAAAWRALQNALPEAREGREIGFLFLPDGEDPDTLVGQEGRESFEQRLDAALPLSEYLVKELGAELDLSHADGRARFAEAARPLLAKIQPGVYRELVLGRVAERIRISPERLEALWNAGAASVNGTRSAIASGGSGTRSRARATTARGPGGRSAGRGGLVRQAVRLLLHFPEIATQVSEYRLSLLDDLNEPAERFLRELLVEVRASPIASVGQLLERWRDRPEVDWLARLAASEALVPDAPAAARELDNAIGRLVEENGRRRIDRLLEKERSSGLEEHEKLELQQLMSALVRRGPEQPRPR